MSAGGLRTHALLRATDRILDAATGRASLPQAAANAAVAEIADWCAVDLLRADGRLDRVASSRGARVDPGAIHDALVRLAIPDPTLIGRISMAKGPVRIEDPNLPAGHRAVAALVAADGEPHGVILALMPIGERAIAEELWFAGELGLRLAQVLELSGAPPATGEVSPPASAAAARLRRALDANELRLVLEPIASIESGEVAAAEAVIELPDPNGAILRPGAIAELGAGDELERAVGAWARAEACRVAAELELRGLGVIVGLDISAAVLASPRVAAAIARDARTAGASPSSLLLEISGAAARTPGGGGAIAALREHGFLLAIDDFGAGSAIPADLLGSSIDVLKLSPGLVAGANHDAQRAERLSAVAELARDLGLDAVAQGVGESELPLVAELGCRWAQGAAIGRPRRLGELIERVGARI